MQTATQIADVLIVDDRPEKHLVYRAILEDLGQNLVTATSGREALKQVLRHDFAVILLDVNMPGLDGLETAALIRSRTKSAHVPIIFITADYADEVRTSKGYSLGAVDYMISPVVPEILRTKVKVFVDLYLLAQQAKRQAEERIALVEERAARTAAEHATQRSAFLARASVALSGSLDFDATAHELPRIVVPFLADVAAIALPGGEGSAAAIRIAWAGAAPTPAALIEPLPHVCGGWLQRAVERVMVTGKGELSAELSAMDGALRLGPAAPDDCLELPLGVPVESVVVLPLSARGRTLGVLVLAMRPSGRRFDHELVAVATDLASRAGVALDNALLYRAIQEQDQRKNEFLAMLSHELRNPLAPIVNAMHVVQQDDVDAAKLSWAKDVISRQLRQLVRLVDDLLDVSRITHGKIDLRIEPVDVAAVVAAAVEASKPVIDAHDHTFTLSMPRKALHVKADFVRLAQVLSNLVNNAAKYTGPRGNISLNAVQDGGEIVFRVRDTGIGIPQESLSSIFELFTQVDRSLDRSQSGLGIGLTLVKRLVEMQGGSVSVYSAGKGRGSEFTVRLPAATGARLVPDTGDARDEPALPDHSGFRVLVVDDNRDVADSTAMLARMAGYDVHLAYDAAVAIDSARRLQPDVVLLDIGLPGIDGYEVAQRIGTAASAVKPWIVAISGYGQDEHRMRSKAAGIDHHIVKPIDPGVLLELLAALESARNRLPENVISLSAHKAAS